MRQAFEVIENLRRRIAGGVEEKHFAAHLVDRYRPASARPVHSFKCHARSDKLHSIGAIACR
jgi:hypothetical protein